MSKIEFKVSAKAARLIGRENISDSTGALLELIKNSYDADADCVFVKLDFKFPKIPNIIDISDLLSLDIEDQNIIKQYYKLIEDAYERIIFDDNSGEVISKILFKYNRIILVDNGVGMDENTVKGPWMHIGTSNKQYNYVSEKGRVKTGAKGIGRFALDKLSLETKMITKCKNDKTIFWEINWDQFVDVKLLEEVSAEFEKNETSFMYNVKTILGPDFDKLSSFNWEHGTILVLSPTREEWNDKQFSKLNNAIASINPFGYIDKFSVYIDNVCSPRFNYTPRKLSLTKDDYDYKISSNFDGKFTLSINIERNELNVDATTIKHSYFTEEKVLNMKDFWSRPAFNDYNYSRDTYYTTKTIFHDLRKDLTKEEIVALKNLGPFEFDFYFTKLQNNSDYPEIIKRIPTRRRNDIFKTFSGIRIYRDKFKVRPYGEFGDPEYDWLGMGARSQKSPAPVAHKTGKWRVLPYQTLGSVKITRINNPFLEDVANREGLVFNAQYELLVKLCQMVLDEFEYDRQYYYREISKWIKENEPNSPKYTIESVLQEKIDINVDSSYNTDSEKTENNSKNDDYTSKNYKDAIKYLASRYNDKDNLINVLLSFCASGIFTNTFAHEIKHIQTDLETRYDQIELCLDDLFRERPYDGPEFNDPYLVISDSKKVDSLLASWVAVLMDGFDSTMNTKDMNNLSDRINNIIDTWKPLLSNKHISINNIENIDFEDNIPTMDLYTVFNNFILNSIWFLEHSNKDCDKEIEISLKVDNEINLSMFNNGPELDEKYKNYPNKIFEAGESSKVINSNTQEKGTGIGLWISKMVLDKNDYNISVMDTKDGFGIVICKKVEK